MARHLLTLWSIVLITAACTPVAPAIELTPTMPPPTLAPQDQKVDVGGYQLRIICTGEGTPTVIVDSALGEPALEMGNWLRVRYGVEKITRICMYDRAGLGSSDPAPTQYRTSQDMVKDLHTLLVNADVPGPYVLVGQNLGGLNARLFASQYPKDVVGMVLIDAVHPDFHTEALTTLPPESPDEPGNLHGLRLMFKDFVIETPEGVNVAASADQVRATGSLGDLPLVVLTQRSGWLISPNLSPDTRAKMEQVWQDLQVDLASLSSNSTHVIAEPAGQTTPADEDQEIIDAILKVVSATKR